ncbi:MAG TPA: glycosyltransferase family 1 protein [Pyrinomonadaceae bacterium]|nr:glycosyltransferase family 1 protein [Pyrinomonadaceae bacterium]
MRIALDGMPLGTTLAGVGHYTLELARSLALASPDDHFTLISPQPRLTAVESQLENLSHVNLQRTLMNRRWWSIGLPLYLRRHSFDLFHGTNYEIPLWWNRPSVVTIHDLSLLLHPRAHEERLVRRARWRLPLMARRAARIITPTEAIKTEVCNHLSVGLEKVVVTREAPRGLFRRLEPAQTVELQKRLGIEKDFILFVGTVEPRKNLERLVQAFEQIVRSTSLTPQLVIAGGEGWLMDDFAAGIAKRGLAGRVLLTGYLHDAELCALYSACSVFVYPSLYEGFGLPLVEAMACGAPVITSDIPSIRETVEDSARLVDPLNVDELARAIVELLSNDEVRRHFSDSGSERVKAFSWERTAERTLQVYREVIGPQVTQTRSA